MNSVVSERIVIVKLVLGKRLVNAFLVYAPHSGKLDEEKESFWNDVFMMVGCMPKSHNMQHHRHQKNPATRP